MNRPQPFRVIEVSDDDQLAAAFEIRREVFVCEQNCDLAAEFDGLDEDAIHLLALKDPSPIGTLRIRILNDGDLAKIERVAVLKPSRSLGVGAELMKQALAVALRKGCFAAKLHAQLYAKEFYAQHGFEGRGRVFDEEGIDHVAMYRSLRHGL